MVNLSEITRILSADDRSTETTTMLAVGTAGSGNQVILTIYDLASDSPVVSAQTTYGYFELHGLEGVVAVEPDEVIFFAGSADRVSGMVLSSSGACSQFSNVDRAILSADPSSVDASHLLAALQLGLIELRPSA